MCAYKVIKAEAGYWGLGARVEKLLISSLRQILLLAHKNTFGLTDEWYHLSYDEVMALEAASHEKLNLGKGTISAHELGPPGGAEEEAVPDKEGEEQGLGTVEVASEASGVVAGGGEREGEVQGQREAEEAEGEREPVGGSSTGEEGYEEMGVEFFEAEVGARYGYPLPPLQPLQPCARACKELDAHLGVHSSLTPLKEERVLD